MLTSHWLTYLSHRVQMDTIFLKGAILIEHVLLQLGGSLTPPEGAPGWIAYSSIQ